MKFFDKVRVKVASGRGGDGVIAGRREKHVPFGGPAGGDGGKGGSVYFVGSENEWTLMQYRFKVDFKAEQGEPGGSSEKYGKDAEDLRLLVPLGTIIRNVDTGEIEAQILEHGQEVCIVKGGKGGVGNMHFTTPQVQYPHIALYGEPGHKKKIVLELQMLADVALVGTPSVGKSSLINVVSNVKAKTAEYHFTTLVPNLGVVHHREKGFTLIDIPGLIGGASSGKGLGNEFLRHVMKSRVLMFMIDASRFEQGREDFGVLLDEIISFFSENVYIPQGYEFDSIECNEENGVCYIDIWALSSDGTRERILTKAISWIINKSDMLGDPEIQDEYKIGWIKSCREQLSERGFNISQELVKRRTKVISAVTKQGVPEVLDQMINLIENDRLLVKNDFDTFDPYEDLRGEIIEITEEYLPLLVEEGYLPEGKNEKNTKIWEIYDHEVCYLTFVLPRGNDEAELRYRRELQKKSIIKKREQHGIKKGDVLKVISFYHGHDDKFVLWQ